MEIFIDSADLGEIRRFAELGLLSGVTTTPTFFRRAGVQDVEAAIREIASAGVGPVHVEALGTSADEIVSCAEKNHALGAGIVSKIPITLEGLRATALLRKRGIPVNVHLVFSLNQAVLAARAGAAYVCVLVGRLNDTGGDAFGLLGTMVEVFRRGGLDTKIMVASVRSAENVARAMTLGVDAVTIPPSVLALMVDHPLTASGEAAFRRDLRLAGPVAQIMRTGAELPILGEEARLHDIVATMTAKRIGIAILVAGDGSLCGVITDGDVRRLLQHASDITAVSARDVMNRAPATVRPDAPATDALRIMEERRVTELVVVDDARVPVGCVNVHDALGRAEGDALWSSQRWMA